MSDLIYKCQTCGRSATRAAQYYNDELPTFCRDRFHDLADLGPAAVELLHEVLRNLFHAHAVIVFKDATGCDPIAVAKGLRDCSDKIHKLLGLPSSTWSQPMTNDPLARFLDDLDAQAGEILPAAVVRALVQVARAVHNSPYELDDATESALRALDIIAKEAP